MMNWIWAGLIALSVVCGAVTGRMNAVSQACISGAGEAVSLFLILLATICLWSGLMKIAQEAGLVKIIGRLLSPVTKKLFPDLEQGGEAIRAITMNITANLLGLGNAATPFGLMAMKAMASRSETKGRATDSMVTFVVINTASIQLIPTTIAAIRVKYGSAAPFDILPAVWLASAVTVCFAVAAAKVMARGERRRESGAKGGERLFRR